MKELFTFDDVLIAPRFSNIASRKEVDLSTNIRELRFKLPIISANMDTITDVAMANAMVENGGQACLHRFQSIEENVASFLEAKKFGDGPMVSIGLGNSELDRAKSLFDVGAHTFVVDVAHGAQKSVVDQVLHLREVVGKYANIVVGNFATADSVKTFLEHVYEVDAIKVGIGPGSACTTRIKTGVGYPQLSAVLEIAELLLHTDIKIIADGGMKTPGDVAKALGAGAHMVMLGGMLAGTYETPGVVVSKDGGTVDSRLISMFGFNAYSKKYRGSASKESYESQGKDAAWRTAEGESFLVPYKGLVSDVLKDVEGGLRSAFTYVGAKNLTDFHNMVEFVKITPATARENGAHGANK